MHGQVSVVTKEAWRLHLDGAMLKSKTENRESVIVLSLAGHLDALNSDDMGSVSDALRSSDARKLVIDLNDLSLMDSTGLGMIVSLHRFTRLKNGEVTVANLKRQPKEVFTVLNLHRSIRVFDSVDQAVDSLQQSP